MFDGAKKWILLVMLLLLIKSAGIYMLRPASSNLSVKHAFVSDVSAQENDLTVDTASSGESTVSSDNATRKGNLADWNYDVVMEIRKREAMVARKQEFLDKEEEMLKALKMDIEKDMKQLQEVQIKIAKLIEQKKVIEDKKMFKLAKVFEATPPEQAGPLLSKLDVDIAAQLILKMSSRKAGRIWGYVDPAKAVDISKELARLKPDFDINKISGNKQAM